MKVNNLMDLLDTSHDSDTTQYFCDRIDSNLSGYEKVTNEDTYWEETEFTKEELISMCNELIMEHIHDTEWKEDFSDPTYSYEEFTKIYINIIINFINIILNY